jgi:2-(1,2-epoxy-1,2-dihydrophenyl)acetyl-CoA isomerase
LSANPEKLVVSLEDGIKRITFNRPERRNSIDIEMFGLLAEAIKESAADSSRAIILTGAGDSFCAGADLAAASAADISSFDVTAHVREHISPAILAMREVEKPIIARVHGPAVGIGFSYALACDLIVASEAAYFSQSFIRIGLMPDGGSSYFLPRLVGYAKAFELMALGEQLSAQDALRLGIINRVVAAEELDATVNALAAQLAAAPRPALARIKAALSRGERAELAAALDFEAVNQDVCFHSADFLEGVTAFMQKRRAVFGKSSG